MDAMAEACQVPSKRVLAVARITLAALSLLAMILMPVFHAVPEISPPGAPTAAMILSGGAVGVVATGAHHHAGHSLPADSATPDGAAKPINSNCFDMAGCPLHAQLAGGMVDLGGSVLTHAVGDVESPDFRAVSRSADSPPPRFHA